MDALLDLAKKELTETPSLETVKKAGAALEKAVDESPELVALAKKKLVLSVLREATVLEFEDSLLHSLAPNTKAKVMWWSTLLCRVMNALPLPTEKKVADVVVAEVQPVVPEPAVVPAEPESVVPAEPEPVAAPAPVAETA